MPYRDILANNNIEAVLWKVLLSMQSYAAQVAPVDTGNLRNAITITTNKRGRRTGKVIAEKAHEVGGFGHPDQPNVGWLGVALTYGPAVEFGRPDMPNYPAQPFLRPSADWMRKRLGMITSQEFKKKSAEYAIRHPFLLVKALNGAVSMSERKP